ncbi:MULTISPECIES: phasin family protein [Paraburkholderia]|uniref:Phasin family protein n=1 Tax=Paraburkholderia dioscoreae TaxID=2604047 RepID=A0A5Q4Z323_9BURK|nr:MULTISPECIES: phasin family protein [Paraburkholderia]MDR8399907.1 phasin family protein [Paraburkholderia sp. USG1]VVD32054.1 Phasin family protein [Paraburkholderia dioscoreae]
MYFSTPDQFISMQSANVAVAFSLAQQTFQYFEELARLNLQAARATLAESEQAWQLAVSGKTPMELFVYQAGNAKPVAEKVLSYNSHLFGIANSAQAEFLKLFEDRFAQSNAKMQTAMDDFSRNAPAGSEVAVTVFKSAVSSAGVAYEAMRKAAAQAIAVAQAGQAAPVPTRDK